jgi:hypothetical protein
MTESLANKRRTVMKTISFPTQISALMIALVLLGGCKVTDAPIETDVAQDAGSSATGSAPIIWGDPETSVLVGTNYVFQPEASDSDGDVLEFSIANKPDWAEFDTTNGVLQGIPGSQHVGQHGNIVISVTDQTSVVSLASFAIAVEAVPTPPEEEDEPTANSPPTISGTPNTSVVVDTQYSFTPDASDPDGDTLSFSIVNKPVWASFNTTTGRLQGTPSSTHIGEHASIDISVTDGSSIAALNRFSITVEPVGTVSKTISWTAPTQNEDGSALTDLAGYRIYYGTSAGDLNEVIELNSAGITSYVIEDLAPGTYFLAMTSFNSIDLESQRTPEITFELGT